MSKTIAFITGTSTGIGYSLTNKLLEEGTSVIGIGRNQKITHDNYTHITADFSDTAETSKIDFKKYVPEDAEKVILINNAGIIEPIQHIGEAEEEKMIRHFNINLLVPALLTNKFIGQLKGAAGEKLIINVSSGAATSPYDGWACYCSSKAGLEMFARTVDQEQTLKGNEFKLYSVSPGVIDTPMQNTIRSADKSSFSNKDKFVNLKESNLLKDPDKIAEDFTYIINNTQKVKDLIISF